MKLAPSIYVVWICAITLLPACKTQASLTPDHPVKVVFGEYGGFAGSYKETAILPDGSIFLKDRFNAEFRKGKNLDDSQVDQILQTLAMLKEYEYSISDPGNMTYYIKWFNQDEEIYELSWGGSSDRPSAMVRQLFKNLKALCKEETFVM